MSLARQLIENDELPTIEKGIPLPLPLKTGDGRHVSKSPWPEFILRLEPGDSFVIPIRQATTVMTIAKWMGVPLVKADIHWHPAQPRFVRVWRAR